MPLRLFVLRHAKSSWSNANLSDHERPLNERGTKSAQLIGKTLKAHGLIPERIMCSSAQRTRETMELLELSLKEMQVTVTEKLYMAGANQLVECIEQTENDYQSLMLIGHNPTSSILVSQLVGQSIDLRTADVAVLSSEQTSWNKAARESWSLEQVIRSRTLYEQEYGV